MKSKIAVVVFTLALAAGSAFAHCGKCGMDGDHPAAAGAAAEGGAKMQCPLHAEHTAVMNDAAKALESSHPELSAKLTDLAANCCGKHEKAAA